MRTLVVVAALLLTAVAVPAEAKPPLPEPNCYEIYSEHHVGPVTIIQRSSCDYEVHIHESGPSVQCMPVYREYDFGAVRIVSPNSCTFHAWVLGERVL